MTSLPLPPQALAAPLPALRTLAGAIGTVTMAVHRLHVAWTHRREAAALAGFNDRMLADIGLTRSDLADAYSEPAWRDPTAVLAQRVAERRASRRRPFRPTLTRLSRGPSIVPDDGGQRADRPVPTAE